jgi:hypothetical protein
MYGISTVNLIREVPPTLEKQAGGMQKIGAGVEIIKATKQKAKPS